MSEHWKVGDKVRLTGPAWSVGTPSGKYRTGTDHLVTGVRGHWSVQLKSDEHYWGLYEGWEIELVERAEEKEMNVSVSEVNVGDKVKLTRGNGDEATFTVVERSESYLNAESNTYIVKGEDTLNILEKKFELVPGIYTHAKRYYTVLVLPDGKAFFKRHLPHAEWVTTDYDDNLYEAHDAVRQQGGWVREITF